MSGGNYEYCDVCDQKALYVGEDDIPEGVIVTHRACQDRLMTEAARVERDQIARLAADRKATYPVYAEPGFITNHAPFADLLRKEPS